jgi:hypothetical protein
MRKESLDAGKDPRRALSVRCLIMSVGSPCLEVYLDGASCSCSCFPLLAASVDKNRRKNLLVTADQIPFLFVSSLCGVVDNAFGRYVEVIPTVDRSYSSKTGISHLLSKYLFVRNDWEEIHN